MNFPTRFIAALTICFASTQPVIADEPRDAPPLLDTIVLWLAANFDLPVPSDAPALVSISSTELVAMRYGPTTTVRPGQVLAVYDGTSSTIYLAQDWSGRTPAELSVLVHEMVHHMQSAADLRFACPAEREALAYRAQDAWLGLFGTNLEKSFGVDAATLLVGTVCTH